MADFTYTVRDGDRGLSQIFLKKAKEAGYEGDASKINWQRVLSVFDEVQAEEKAEGEQLYSGGNDKTCAGWKTSYIVKIGDVINLTRAQIDKIYTAMGFRKAGAAGGGTDPAGGGTTPPADTGLKGVNTEQAKKDYDSIKVTVPMKEVTAAKPESQEEIEAIKKNQQEGYEVAEKILALNDKIGFLADYNSVQDMKDALSLITRDNVLYVLEKIPNLAEMIDDVDALGNGLDKDDVIKYVFIPLGQKGDEYGWGVGEGEDRIPLSEYYEQKASGWSLEKIEQKMEEDVNDFRKEELSKLNYASELEQVNKENAELTKAQQAFDNANKLLADVANMEPKPEIISVHNDKGNYDWKIAELPDGRWIEARYDENGEITSIRISYDTTQDTMSNGTKHDGAEVRYDKNGEAWYDTDKNNSCFEGYITSGYDFEKLKAIAEKIFGKNVKAE